MYDNNINSIIKAQNGDKDEMERLIQENQRTYLEYCKKIYEQRL